LGNLPGPPAAPPTTIYSTCTPGTGGPDSTTVVNGKTIYWYSLPSIYSFSTVGTYPVTITTFFPGGTCGNSQDIDFDLQISSPPLPSYAVVTPGCYMERAEFIETTVQTPKPTYKWFWDFGDGNTSTLKNPSHTYAAPGTYITRYSSITTPGCLSDTISQTIVIPDVPSATIGGSNTVCINTGVENITFTASSGRPPYQFSYNINGGGAQTVSSTGTNTSVTIPVSTSTAGTFVYTLDSVKNVGSTVCTKTIAGQSATIIVNPDASIALTSAPATNNQTLCINTPITDITYAVGGGGSGAGVTGLPAGLTGTYAAGVFTITGTPTAAGTFNYTVTTTGICVQKTATGTITVNPDASIALSSPSGSDAQSLCINTLLNNITYIVSGGGTGATVTGLPAGITGSYSSGVFTIAGAPTVTGTFNYTITTTGICIQKTATGSITVNPDAAIALTSAPVTANQTLCINTAITNITYAVTGGGTGAVITGLPAGITGVYAAGNVLISGTPTVSGTFNYTVTTTGTCIQKTANGTITVNPDADITLTSAPATTNQSLCINTNISTISYNLTGGATGATITGLPAGVTGTYSAGTFTIIGAPSVSGTFNYTINTTGICIQKTATGTIIVNPDAAIALTSAPATSNQTLCINTGITTITYSVTGGGTGASVSGLPAGVTGTYAAGVVTITGIPSVTGTFNYTVTTTGTCIQKTATGTILVNPDAAIALTSAPATTNQELCATASISAITYSITGGGTGATVSGLPSGVSGVYSAGVFTITGTPTVSGVYNYTVNTTGICIQKTATGTITVDALPTPNFTFSNPDCENKTIVFTDASVANTGSIANVQWTFGDATNGTGSPVSHSYSAAGVYTAGLIVTTTKGCSNPVAFTKPVTVTVNPKAGFVVPEVCINDIAAVFTDTSKISAGTITNWFWDFGDPISGVLNTATTKDGTHLYTNTGSYTVKHIAYSSTGCSDTVINTIFINGANPTANFTVNNPATLCANDSVAITNTSTVSPGSVTKVEIYWDNINTPTTVQTDDFPFTGKVYRHLYPNFQTPLTKTFQVRMVAYSGSLCFADKLTTITINAAPKVQFNAMSDVCYDAAPFQITQASEIGGVPGFPPVYSGPGVSSTGVFSPAIAGIGTHWIKYTFTSSAGGCVDTLSRPIRVLDTASAKFSLLTPTCQGSITSFTDESTAPSGVTLNNTVWDFGDGTLLESHAPGSTFSHTFTLAGNYTVKMYTTSAYGCKSTTRTRNVVISPIPDAKFLFGETSVCLPSAAVSFINQSTIADGSESGFKYAWSFGDPSSGFLNNSLAKTPPPHIYTALGPFSVSLTVTSDSGCIKSFSKIVDFIHPQPKAAFTMSKSGVCIGDVVTFNDITNGLDGAVNQWFWKFGDATTGNTKSVTHQYTDTLVYDVSLYIVNTKGCNSDTLTQQFTVYPYPAFDAGPDQVVLEGGSTTLLPNIIRGTSLQYLWTPATYLNDNTIVRPVASNMLDDITYTLQVTGRGGCVAPTDKVFIKILKAPQVPNTFTPNGDGINELWKIEYLDTYPDCKVQVFTRNGQQVFESKGYKTPWDGTIKGKALPFDTYYYIIEPGNGRKPITGYVTIMK
jgi:gliding motility-associated-like protein